MRAAGDEVEKRNYTDSIFQAYLTTQSYFRASDTEAGSYFIFSDEEVEKYTSRLEQSVVGVRHYCGSRTSELKDK